MKQSHHGSHLIQLTKWGAFNCYFVREDDGLTLIDALMPNDGKAILAAAETIGQPIKRITLTHAHSDHVGALDELAASLPDAEIVFTSRAQQFLQGNLSLLPDEATAKLKGGFPQRKTQSNRHLEADDRVGSLRVIPAPGHSPDHIAFLDTRDGTLIAGDSFQTKAGIAVAGTLKLLFPFPAMATWHKATALESAKQLRDLKPSRLAVGHGPIIENPLNQMTTAINRAQRH